MIWMSLFPFHPGQVAQIAVTPITATVLAPRLIVAAVPPAAPEEKNGEVVGDRGQHGGEDELLLLLQIPPSQAGVR